MLKKSLLILIYLACVYSYAQSTQAIKIKDSSTIWQDLKYDTELTIKSVAHAYSSPARWDKDDFRKLTTLSIGVFALSIADETTSEFFINQDDNYPEFVKEIGFRMGKPQVFFALNAGLYSYGLFTKNPKIRRTSILIISSAITAGTLQSISKTAIGRARPNSGLGYDTFKPFSSQAQFHSFPSGHTVLSVTMAHAIAKQVDNFWLKAGIYSIGAITPITRLVDGAHWLTDVTVGAILSIVVVDCIDKFLFEKNAYSIKKEPKISWNFTFSGNQIGFVGTF